MDIKKNPVYVVNKKGKPLDPTYRYGRVRKLLESKKAVPISNEPFTIRLKYETPDIVQGLYGGLDTGRENLGLAASDDKGNSVYLSDVKTNNKSLTYSHGSLTRLFEENRGILYAYPGSPQSYRRDIAGGFKIYRLCDFSTHVPTFKAKGLCLDLLYSFVH